MKKVKNRQKIKPKAKEPIEKSIMERVGPTGDYSKILQKTLNSKPIVLPQFEFTVIIGDKCPEMSVPRKDIDDLEDIRAFNSIHEERRLIQSPHIESLKSSMLI